MHVLSSYLDTYMLIMIWKPRFKFGVSCSWDSGRRVGGGGADLSLQPGSVPHPQGHAHRRALCPCGSQTASSCHDADMFAHFKWVPLSTDPEERTPPAPPETIMGTTECSRAQPPGYPFKAGMSPGLTQRRVRIDPLRHEARAKAPLLGLTGP